MINRLALAQRFIEAQLAKRTDIVGAWVCGSTARGEDTEASDIDVALVIAGDSGQSIGARDSVDGWHIVFPMLRMPTSTSICSTSSWLNSTGAKGSAPA